jgi:prepilin-type N-terminal cleavage/methylation domain-containing protein
MNWQNSSMYKVRRRYRGFTLLEIMLAVAILGMMALAIFRLVQTNLTELQF